MSIIYDEARVPAYTLPDPLVLQAGSPVTDARVWNEQRRPELLDLFARCVYGQTPTERGEPTLERRLVDPAALGGAATRIEVRLLFGPDGGPFMDLLLYLPNRPPTAVAAVCWPQLPGQPRHSPRSHDRTVLPVDARDGQQRRGREPRHRGVARVEASRCAS